MSTLPQPNLVMPERPVVGAPRRARVVYRWEEGGGIVEGVETCWAFIDGPWVHLRPDDGALWHSWPQSKRDCSGLVGMTGPRNLWLFVMALNALILIYGLTIINRVPAPHLFPPTVGLIVSGVLAYYHHTKP